MMSPLLLLSCFKLVKDIFNYLSRYVLRQALTMRAYIQLRKRGVRHAVINYEQSLSTLSDHDFSSRQRKEYLRGENSSEKVEGGKFHFLARRTIESRLHRSQIYLSQWESSSNLARFASQTKFVVCIISNGNRTECSPIRSVIIRVITKSDDRADSFITSMITNCPIKNFAIWQKKIFPRSYELFRVASAKVPQHYKEQKDYCLILNVTS